VDGEPKRYKIITLEHSFHGRTITALKATGQESMHNYFGPFPDGFVYAKNIDEIESLLDEHTVAVMIELVQGEGGVQPLDREKVQALSKLLRSKDVLLMVDEVQTGIYRTGEFLASNLYDIQPDVITLAKGLGGGVPIGVVMTNRLDIFAAGDHGSTFGGNYLSTAAANEVLDILEELKNSGELDETLIYFEQALSHFATKHRAIFMEHVGFGLMRGLRVVNADTLGKIINAARNEGLIVLKAGRNTLRFLPPLTITKEDISEGFARLEKAMASL
jgi:acetylornithine aminotransferase